MNIETQRASFEAWYESAIWGNEDFKSSLGIAYTQGYQAALASPEVQALRKDAERYRLLRRGQKWSVINGIGDALRADALDAAIDAAMEATK